METVFKIKSLTQIPPLQKTHIHLNVELFTAYARKNKVVLLNNNHYFHPFHALMTILHSSYPNLWNTFPEKKIALHQTARDVIYILLVRCDD